MFIFPHVTEASRNTDPRVAEILLQNIPPEDELALEYAKCVSLCNGRRNCPGRHNIHFSEGITGGLESLGNITFQCSGAQPRSFESKFLPRLQLSKAKRASMILAISQLTPMPIVGGKRQAEMKKELKSLLEDGFKQAPKVAAKVEAENRGETLPARRTRSRTLSQYYARSSPLRPAPRSAVSRQVNSSPIPSRLQSSREFGSPATTPSSSSSLGNASGLGTRSPPRSSEPSSSSQESDPFAIDSSPISLPSLKTIADEIFQGRKRKVATARMSTGGHKPVPPFLASSSSTSASSSSSTSTHASSSKGAREDLGLIDLSSDSDGEYIIWKSPLGQKRKRGVSRESPTLDRKGKRRAF